VPTGTEKSWGPIRGKRCPQLILVSWEEMGQKCSHSQYGLDVLWTKRILAPCLSSS